MNLSKLYFIVLTVVITILNGRGVGAQEIENDYDEIFGYELGDTMFEMYINENSKEYKSLGAGKTLFASPINNAIAKYKIRALKDDSIQLILTEVFKPFSEHKHIIKKYEYEIKEGEIYEFDVVKPYRQYCSEYSYILYNDYMDPVEIPYFQDDIEIFAPTEIIGRSDAEIPYPSDQMKELSFCKVRAWAVPANGMKKNDPRFVWGSLITALGDMVDKSYKIGEGLYYGGKEFNAIPDWVA